MSYTIEDFPFYDASHPLRVPVSRIIQAELYHDDDPLEYYRLDRELTEDLHVLALLLGGTVTATASVRTDTLASPESIIDNVAVDKKYQGCGLGAIVLSAAEDYIIDHSTYSGQKTAKLEPSNVAIPFYTHLGYSIVSDDPEIMAKIIS